MKKSVLCARTAKRSLLNHPFWGLRRNVRASLIPPTDYNRTGTTSRNMIKYLEISAFYQGGGSLGG